MGSEVTEKDVHLARIHQQEKLMKSFEKAFDKAKGTRGKRTAEFIKKLENERRNDAISIEENNKLLHEAGNVPEAYVEEYNRIMKLNDEFMKVIQQMAEKNEVEVDVLRNNATLYVIQEESDDDDLNKTVLKDTTTQGFQAEIEQCEKLMEKITLCSISPSDELRAQSASQALSDESNSTLSKALTLQNKIQSLFQNETVDSEGKIKVLAMNQRLMSIINNEFTKASEMAKSQGNHTVHSNQASNKQKIHEGVKNFFKQCQGHCDGKNCYQLVDGKIVTCEMLTNQNKMQTTNVQQQNQGSGYNNSQRVSNNSHGANEMTTSANGGNEGGDGNRGNGDNGDNGNNNDGNNEKNKNTSMEQAIEEMNSTKNENNALMSMLVQGFLKLTEATTEAQKNINSARPTGLKAQKLEINCFEGDILEYISFKELFQLTIKRANYEKLEAMVFLKSKLKGRALDRIKHLATEGENYDIAWKILDNEFLVTRTLLQHNLNKLKSVKNVKHNDVNGMRNFYSTLSTVITNLAKLETPPENWIFELIYMELDVQLRTRFEDFIRAKSLTAGKDSVTTFLMQECNALEAAQISSSSKEGINNKQVRTHVTEISSKQNKNGSCFICQKEHKVADCAILLASNKRSELLKKYHVCIFCLKHKYFPRQQCKSKNFIKCNSCSENHHSLLHNDMSKQATTMMIQNEVEEFQNILQQVNSMVTESNSQAVILPTAIAYILSVSNEATPICSLIDLCSERSYITEEMVNFLKLKRKRTSIIIKGINNLTGKASSYVTMKIKLENEMISVDAIIVPQITGNLPTYNLDSEEIKGLKLANPYTSKNSYIGCLLGGDVMSQLLLYDKPPMQLKSGHTLMNSKFGWIVSGKSDKIRESVHTCITYTDSLMKIQEDEKMAKQIMNFYDLPDEPLSKDIEEENEYCERIFKEQHYYDTEQHRYHVPMLWKPDTWNKPEPPLGSSFRTAMRFYIWMENRLTKNPSHLAQSNEFMRTYRDMDHMRLVPRWQWKDESGNLFYIPYLNVIKTERLSTKFRNVFNGSVKSSNGVSMNDLCYEGKKLQNCIVSILVACRAYKYVISADVAKFYRQVALIPADCERMRILWRENQMQPIQEFKMTRLVYGTTCAAFLSNRTMIQCIDDHCNDEKFKKRLKAAVYVDDIWYGAHSIEEGKEAVNKINETLGMGSLPVMKYVSNEEKILSQLDEDKKISACMDKKESEIKLLGVMFNPNTDTFRLKIDTHDELTFTKRGVSSAAAKIYDPLQLFLPFIMTLRLFLQQLWTIKLNWDDELPDVIKNKFIKLMTNIEQIKEINVPRWICSHASSVIQLIGFSDASAQAYATCIYSRVINSEGKIDVNLICAKGKVAKLKNPQTESESTIPKLEITAVLLMAQLMDKVKKSFEGMQTSTIAYCDAKIVLHWLRGKSSKNKFVRRKVEQIKSLFNPQHIHYVRTNENPSDAATRPITLQETINCDLWWNGPGWMKETELPITTDEELKSSAGESQCLVATSIKEEENMLVRFSKWCRMLRAVALILRWKKYKRAKNATVKLPLQYEINEITSSEVTAARQAIMKYFQINFMSDVVAAALEKRVLPRGHWARRLSPFMDHDGLVHVNGRMGDFKPILIPKVKMLQEMLVRHIHLENFHAGNSLTQCIIGEKWYITGVKRTIHKVISRCTNCKRFTKKKSNQFMAELPAYRYEKAQPFENVGTDLAGHFHVKAGSLRFDKQIKCWIVVFVCMATRAVHLEVVKALSVEEYLHALTRFTSRRGVCGNITADNGSNLRGTNKVLQEAHKKLCQQLSERTALKEIKFNFIPSQSPSFNGISEAVVKSLKFFTKRMENIPKLTIDEFNTVIIKVEGLLNSRPLFPLSQLDSNSFALTPFHFLATKVHEVHAAEISEQKLPLTKKWLLITELVKSYWKQFKGECYIYYQNRAKWIKKEENLKTKDIVIIRDKDSSPGEWRLGRITKTFPDPQGIVRKVNIINAAGRESQQSVRNLIPLLTEEENQKVDTMRKNISAPIATRLRGKISVTQVLVTWLALMHSAQALANIKLEPGIHVIDERKLQRQADLLELKFIIAYNMTEDVEKINTTINDFHESCKFSNETQIIAYCSTWHTALKEELSSFQTSVTKENRGKRAIGAVAGVLATIVISAGIGIWQYLEIKGLEKQVEAKEKQLKASMYLLYKLNNVQFNETNHGFLEMEKMLQLMTLENDIKSNAIDIIELIRLIKERYKNAEENVPNTDIKNRAVTLVKDLPRLTIPETKDEAFFNELKKVTKVEKEQVTVTVQIPLVEKKVYHEKVIIIIPNERQETINAFPDSNTNLAETIIVDDRNETFIQAKKVEISEIGTFKAEELKEVTNCMKSVINGKMSNCQLIKFENHMDILKVVHQHLIIINPKGTTSLQCGSSSRKEEGLVAIIKKDQCNVTTEHHQHYFMQPQIVVINKKVEVIEFEKIKSRRPNFKWDGKEITELRQQLKKSFQFWEIEDLGNISTNPAFLMAAIAVSILGLIAAIFACAGCQSWKRKAIIQTNQKKEVWAVWKENLQSA